MPRHTEGEGVPCQSPQVTHGGRGFKISQTSVTYYLNGPLYMITCISKIAIHIIELHYWDHPLNQVTLIGLL